MALSGKHVLITSGPTRGNIDAVRYISNRSSGKLGAIIAEEALRAGARVTFVYGWGSQTPREVPSSAQLAPVVVETVDDVLNAVERVLTTDRPDAVIHLMAVLDYVPADPLATKTPSGQDEWTIRLVRTPKVIKSIRRLAPEAYLVSFKLEVDRTEGELIRIAHESLQRNGSQLVVANDLSQIDATQHVAHFVDRSGRVTCTCHRKGEIAASLVAQVERALGAATPSSPLE